MNLKNLLGLALMLILSTVNAQTPAHTHLATGFDAQQARKEAKNKNIPQGDIDGYVRAARARYISQQYNDAPKEYKERITFAQLGTNKVIGQTIFTSLCQNSDLALGDYSNWQGDITTDNLSTSESVGLQYPIANYNGTGINGTNGTPVVSNTDPCNSFNVDADRHIVMTMPITTIQNNNPQAFLNGYDPSCCNQNTSMYDLPMRPDNSTNSIRMGSAYPYYTCEKLVYPVTVSNANKLFTYQFAVVINDGGHGPGEQPAFRFAMKDINGNVLTQGGSAACVQYDIDATQAINDPTYIRNSINNPCFNSGSNSTYYRKWQTVTIDLSAYVGSVVYAEFQTLDCVYSGHFCYAYVTATCGALNASVSGFCGGQGSATMTGPAGFASYQWYGPNNMTPIPGATSYSYTATNAQLGQVYTVDCVTLQGCTTQLVVTVASSNILSTPNSTPSCRGGSNGSAGVTVTGGTQYTYSWSPTPGSTSSITNQPAGAYSVLIKDLTGNCPDTTVAITIAQTLPILQTATVQLCGTQLSPPLTVPAGSLPNYAWYLNGVAPVISTSATLITGTVAPTDDFTATYINQSTGCLDSLKTTMSPVNISFSQSSSPPCNGGNNGSITVNPSGGNTYTIYDWTMNGSPGGDTVAIPPSLQITGLPQGNYTININPTGNPSCTYSLTVQLVQGVIPPPTLDTLKGCGLENLSIPTNTVSGNTHSWWQGTTSLGSAYPYTTTGVTTGAVYTDTIRNSFGCVSVYKAYLKKKDFNLTLTAPEKLKCNNDSNGKLKATVTTVTNGPLGTPFIFNWNFPNPYPDPAQIIGTTAVPQSVLVTNLQAGTYTITVTSGSCVQTRTITLTNPPLLPRDSLFAYFCPKDSIVWLYAEPGHSTYNWLQNGVPLVPANNDDSLQVTPATINDFMVWYMQGDCRDTASKLFIFPAYHAFRPDKTANIFTPNGDKRNDHFYPFYDASVSQYEIAKQVEEYEIVIYNRWGKKVFEGTSYSTPWGGEADGKPQDDGTYYYILKFKPNCGTKADIIEKHGFVQLLR